MQREVGIADVRDRSDRLELGARLVALAGLSVFLYGAAFLVVDFTRFVEVGLTSQQVGGDAASIEAVSVNLYHYISHLQVAISAFIIAYGAQLMALAWYGIRSAQAWALWTIAISALLAYAIGVPLHFVYGFATLVHLGPFGLVAIVLAAGLGLAWTGLPSAAGSGREGS
jgi:hypothetical protein